MKKNTSGNGPNWENKFNKYSLDHRGQSRTEVTIKLKIEHRCLKNQNILVKFDHMNRIFIVVR